MPEIGKAYVQIVPSAEGISGDLENLLSGEAGSAGTAAGELFSANFGGALGGITEISSQVISSVVGAIGSITSELSSGISDVAAYGDNIDKLSQKMGISAQAYQEWDFIAQHSGTTMESIKGSFKTLSNAAQNNAEEFERLGISLDDVSSMSTEELFGAVIGGLQEMEEGTERTSVASKLLGKGATELGALLNTSAEDTEAMKQAVHDLGGVLSDEAIKDAAAYQDSLQDLTVSFEGLQNNLMANFLPSITEVMNGLTALITGDESGLQLINEGISDFITSISEQLPEIIPIVTDILLNIGNAIIENLPIITEAGVEIITGLADGIMEQIPALLEAGIEIITTLLNGIANAIPGMMEGAANIIVQLAQMITNPENMVNIVSAGIEIITSLATGIIDSIPILIEALPNIINNIVTTLIGLLPLLIEGGVNLITGIVNALPEIISGLIGALPEVISNIAQAIVELVPVLIEASITLIKAIVEAMPEIIKALVAVIPDVIDALIKALVELTPLMIEAFFELFTAVIENMPEIIKTIAGAIPDIITGIINALVENFPTIAATGLDLFLELITNIPEAIVDIVASAGEIVTAVIDALVEGFKDIGEIGKNIVIGLWEGFKEKWAEFVEDINQKVHGFIGDVKNFLGIASPSKVFKEIGNFIVAGLDEGTEDLGEGAIIATREMIDTINKMLETDSLIIDGEIGSLNYGQISRNDTDNYLYNLLSTYLPIIASGENYNKDILVDGDKLFSLVKTKNGIVTQSTGFNPMVSS